jgi:glycosyltransferase involved in cell wall biosynthesis
MFLVTIIIPCYNQGKFLQEALESVFYQAYTDWECLIVNDGSTDNTEDIALLWVTKDSRFRYYKKENSGVSATRNYGLENAHGDYIQFLDADDVLSFDKLSVSIDAFQKHQVTIVCSNYQMFSKSIKNIQSPFSQLENFEFNFYNLARYWNDGFTIPIHCWVFKATLLDNIQFPVCLTAQEDWVTWLTIFHNSPSVYYIHKPLAFYRINPYGRTQTSGFFNETLQAINYCKTFLNETDFQILYEATIVRYNSGMLYWRKREVSIKKTNTYQFGLMSKRLLRKIGLLSLAKKVFLFIKPSK